MKKVLYLLLVVVVISSLTAHTFALAPMETISSDVQIMNLTETTALSHEDYVLAYDNLDYSTPSNIAVQTTCELFISSIFAARRNPSHDFYTFTTRESQSISQYHTLAYIDSWNEYQREINKLCDYNIVSDSIRFEHFSANIAGNTCTAEVAVNYNYTLTGSFNKDCSLSCIYYLTLIKSGSHWKIIGATTSMPCEQATNFVYGSFDAHAAALAVVASDETEEYTHESASPFFEEDISPNALAPYRRTAYNVASAVRYAETYYNKTNTLFGRSGANCQNFASQCIWAGLRPDCNLSGAATSNTLIPAVSTSLVGSNAPNVWCRSQSISYYSHYSLNWAWDNVNGFLKLILESSYTQAGPQGYYLLGISKARIGDEIAWDTTGSRNLNNGDFDHAMFVTDVNGVYGSRDTDNIFIAANTTDTTSASMPLAQYCSYPANYFATAQIVGGYYRAIEKNTPES